MERQNTKIKIRVIERWDITYATGSCSRGESIWELGNPCLPHDKKKNSRTTRPRFLERPWIPYNVTDHAPKSGINKKLSSHTPACMSLSLLSRCCCTNIYIASSKQQAKKDQEKTGTRDAEGRSGKLRFIREWQVEFNLPDIPPGTKGVDKSRRGKQCNVRRVNISSTLSVRDGW